VSIEILWRNESHLRKYIMKKTGHISLFIYSLIVFLCIFLFWFEEQAKASSSLNQPESCEIEFILVSRYGETGDINGRVSCLSPENYENYRVAVYIYVPGYGWVIKPYWNEPLTSIRQDGTWSCRIVTSSTDKYATKVIAFLLPYGQEPPILGGAECIPVSLYQFPHVETMRLKALNFAGYKWWIKNHTQRLDPGWNLFSDSVENVFVDSNDHLHLKIIPRDGQWYCSEVISATSFGYGTYVFVVEGNPAMLDYKNTVLGLFTYENCPAWQELDVELSTWWNKPTRDPNSLNAQFVVQPWYRTGNMYRFSVDLNKTTTYEFTWKQDEVTFKSYYGDYSSTPRLENIITNWTYRGPDVPSERNEHTHINLWLLPPENSPSQTPGEPPSDSKEQEIVIRDFRFLPESLQTVKFPDFALFAQNWHDVNCGRCGGADLTADEKVGAADLKVLLSRWLAEAE
jgi:hypothetical protein